MTFLSILVGIIMVIAGFSCMFTPLATFLYTGYFIGCLLLVYGILGLCRAIKNKTGALSIVVAVLAILVGLISVFKPGKTLVFDGIIIYLIAFWFTLQGILSIMMAFKVKDEKKGWYWGVIVGILGVLVGLYSFGHPVLTAVTAGVLIGLYFVQSGIDMIILAVAIEEVTEE